MLRISLAALLSASAIGTAAQAQVRVPAQLGVHDQPACSSTHRQGLDNVRDFSRWLGRKPDRIVEFGWLGSWADMVRSTGLLSGCWRRAGYTQLTMSMPMLPRDGVSTLRKGADGAYDAYFREMGAALVANGQRDAIIRLGWEFNIPNFPWAAAKDPGAFIAYWRRIHAILRATPGSRFRFEWCPTGNGWPKNAGAMEPSLAYPGDAYVDIIGLDIYNEWWGKPGASADVRWQFLMDKPNGLKWHRDFAKAHNKPMAFAEWATGQRPDGHGSGDDAYFIEQMAKWIASNDVVYQAYWNKATFPYAGRLTTGKMPKAAAAYRAAFARHP